MLNKFKIIAFSLWLLCVANNALGTEYVPVYMWETTRHTETIPALDRISEDSFKDLLLERLAKNPFVVIFAERNLSPEDFARHGSNGQSPFSSIAQLKSSAKVTYWPFVHSPIRAVKQLDKRITEIVADNLEDLIIPNDEILIVDLNDARDNEDRIDMLKRHDDIIAKIYKQVLEENDNVLAVYTAHHTSWVIPEDVRTHRRVRSLLAETDASSSGLIYNTPQVLLYVNSLASYSNNASGIANNTLQDYNASINETNGLVTLQLSSSTKDVTAIEFIIQFKSGYWYLNAINVQEKSSSSKSSLKVKDVYAPVGFSYHCTAGIFYGANTTQSLSLPKFQLQAFNTTNRTQTAFGDAYDCVGFTSAPIWSGLFVTFILALIMTFGLTFMMDIKTMDRFDDPKGKTITVNVTE